MESCGICYDEIGSEENAIVMCPRQQCSKIFHCDCFRRWGRGRDYCPYCFQAMEGHLCSFNSTPSTELHNTYEEPLVSEVTLQQQFTEEAFARLREQMNNVILRFSDSDSDSDSDSEEEDR